MCAARIFLSHIMNLARQKTCKILMQVNQKFVICFSGLKRPASLT